jgi:hypothetical protein
MLTVPLPFEVMNQPFVLPTAGEGWFVGCREGGGLVTGGAFHQVPMPGSLTAACFEGGRLFLAFARTGDKKHTLLADSVGELVAGTVKPWARLEALGKAARPVPWLTRAGADDVIFTSSLAREPHGRGWALHRIDARGRIVTSFELVPSPSEATMPISRRGDLLLGSQRAFDLDLVERPFDATLPPLVAGRASVRGAWTAEAGHSTTLTVMSGVGRAEVPLEKFPNHLVDGGAWVAWSSGKKLFVRRDDGEVLRPKTGGRTVLSMATRAGQLAVLARGEIHTAHADSRLLLIDP